MSFVNEERQPAWGGYAPLASDAESWARSAFIRRTYMHLLGAVIAFTVIEAILLTVVPADTFMGILGFLGGWTWLLFLGGFMVVSWVARSWAESTTSVGTQYAGLALYVVAEAVIFAPLLFIATHFTNDPNLLPSAALITVFIFGGLTAVTFITKQDFSFLGSFLWWGGIAAIAIIFFGILFGFSLGFWFSAGMILLASGYILYDTSNVMHHYRTDQHVAASLALFASVALLFWYVIQLLMILSGRD